MVIARDPVQNAARIKVSSALKEAGLFFCSFCSSVFDVAKGFFFLPSSTAPLLDFC